MKKQTSILIYFGIFRRAACWWGLVVGLILVCGSAMAELTPIILKHDNYVDAIAFSPDGKLLATGAEDRTAKVWEMPSGKLLATLKHEGDVEAVDFSPDGTLLATGSYDHTAKVWEMPSGKLLATLKHEDDVEAVDFSPDGKLLATGSDNNAAKVWQVSSGRLLATLKHKNFVYSVSFSPDGKLLATGSYDHTAKVWEIPSGKLLATLKHYHLISSISFSPDGKLLATGSYDNTAKVWEIPSGKLLATLKHDNWVYFVTFSPDGKLLATGSYDETARVWNIPSYKVLTTLHHDYLVSSISFTPGGKLLATGSYDTTAKVWKISSDKLLVILNHDDYVSSVAFSFDGKLLATASKTGAVKVWAPHNSDTPVLTEPFDGSDFSDAFPELKWESIQNAAYQAQVAKDKEFSQMELETTTDTESLKVSVEQPEPGTYFWRVRTIGWNNFGQWSKTRTFKLTTPPVPVFSTPINEQIFTQKLPTFTSDSDAIQYRMQIAKDANFSQILWEQEISGAEYSLSLNDLSNGTYYWRGADVSGIIRSEWSKVRSFKIIFPVVSVQVAQQSDLDAAVEIRIENAKNVYGFQFGLEFDPVLLEVVNVEPGKFLGDNISWNAPIINQNRGTISGVSAMTTSNGGSSGKGVFAKIHFKIKELKDSSELILRDVRLLNSSGEYIQHFIEQGGISFPAEQK